MSTMRWGDPRRMAWLSNFQSAVASQFSFVTLFNNSTGPHVLCVRDIVNDNLTPGRARGWLAASGQVGTAPVLPSPAFAGEAIPVGFSLTGSVAALSNNLNYFGSGAVPNNNSVEFPFVFLPPGYSLTTYANVINVIFAVTFWYEWRFMWEFPVMPNSPDPD